MNPDEDSKVKSEGFEKIEEEKEEIELKGKGKKREVETLELLSDGEVKDEGEVEPVKKKQKKKVVVAKKENEEESPKKTKTDAQGNVKLDGFFPVLD